MRTGKQLIVVNMVTEYLYYMHSQLTGPILRVRYVLVLALIGLYLGSA